MAVERQHEDAAAGHSHDIYTLANTITVLRLILVPFAFSALISDRSDVLAFVLFAAAASTDWLDGQIARRTGTVTELGKAIDPLVDRVLIVAGVVGLWIIGRVPVWLVVVLVSRDIYLLSGAFYLNKHSIRVPVSLIGKATTFVLLTGFASLILGWPEIHTPDGLVQGGLVLVYVGLVLSLTAVAEYTVRAWSGLRQKRSQSAT